MSLFRKAKLSMFRDERALELEEFSNKAMAYIQETWPSERYLVDVMKAGAYPWMKLMEQPWVQDKYPLIDNQGNLDFIAGCIADGIDLELIGRHICSNHSGKFLRDMVECGLHGVHFRMDLKNESDRIAYTCELANLAFDTEYELQRRYTPVTSFSLLARGLKLAIDDFLSSSEAEEYRFDTFSYDELVALTSSDYRGFREGEEEEFFRQSVLNLLTGKVSLEDMSPKELALAVEKALISLVYNFGYKLKAEGVGNAQVIAEASRRIDTLLSFVPSSPDFQGALRRQILINLFSAFPDGLELLQAQPEELQGVMLNPVLIDDPLAKLFSKTLAGPVALFTQRFSLSKHDRAEKLIGFLNATPYPVHLDIAINGYLADQSEIVYLAYKHPAWSAAVEEKLLREGDSGKVARSLAFHLTHPDRLKDYSDATVLKMIAHALALEVNIMETGKQRNSPGGQNRSPTGFASVAPVLKERPHLFEQVLEMLEERDFLKPGMIEWCGFGPRELKALGKRAPNALKQHLLESSLGL